MRRPAEARRAQAAAEWAAVVAAVAVALAAGSLAARGLAGAVAARLDHGSTRPGEAELAAAAGGDDGALGLLGVRAWLAEGEGRAMAEAAVDDAVRAELARSHPAWGGALRLVGPAVRGRRTITEVRPTGPVAVHVVGVAEEAAAGAQGTPTRDRAAAGATSLGWAAAQSLAQRIARPLGLAVAAVQMALSMEDQALAPPAGERAGDAIACRAVEVRTTGGPVARPRRIAGLWRVGILRDGRLVADAVRAGPDPCRAPADG